MKKRTLRILLACLIVVSALAVMEAGLRVFGFVPRTKIRPQIHRYPDETDRIRDPRSSLSSQDARPMTVCLGDSFTYGMGVSREHTYPGRLEKLLDGEVRFINLGKLGSGPLAQKELLAEAMRHEPALVILGALINDAVDAQREEAWPTKGLPAGPPTAITRLVRWLRSNTASYSFLDALQHRVRGIPFHFEHRGMTYEDLRKQKFLHYISTVDRGVWEELVFPIWLEMHRSCADREIPFLLVLFPFDVQLWESSSEIPQVLEIQRRVRTFAEESQIPFCDLTDSFWNALQSGDLRLMYSLEESERLQSRLISEASPALFLVDGHPSLFGYEIAAREIAKTISEHSLLSLSPDSGSAR